MVEGETLLVLLSVTRGHTLVAMAPPTSLDVEAAVQQQAAHDNKHSAGKKAQVMVEGETLLVSAPFVGAGAHFGGQRPLEQVLTSRQAAHVNKQSAG